MTQQHLTSAKFGQFETLLDQCEFKILRLWTAYSIEVNGDVTATQQPHLSK
jgi:trehalose/maltose hydrolase-like predicted phosphorylase